MKDPKIEKYLHRINLQNSGSTLEDLRRLQRNHMQNIPFENLDVVAGRTIHLDPEYLFEKIITSKRGGYCFELNTSYFNLLQALGFSVKKVLGRVWLRNPEQTPPRNHLALLVTIDGETYVTDVGFGALTTRVPLRINDSSDVKDNDGFVRIIPFREHQFMIQRKVGNEWANQYSFETVAISEVDIQMSNYYMSTNPDSHFYKDNFVGLFTETGRVGLYNHQLSTRKGTEVVDKKQIPFGTEWKTAIKKYFSLEPDFSPEEWGRLFEKTQAIGE